MNQTANRLRHIHNEAAIASQSNPFEVMMNGLKEEFGCVSQRYDAIMDIALFYIADELDELQAKVDGLRKQVPTERERHILDMWPRFEEGEPVMVGDRFIDHRVNERTVRSVIVNDDGVELRTFDGTFDWHETGERVKRPAPKVLDADGVEIKVGDTVWFATTGRGGFRVDRIERRINGFWALEQFCDGTVSNSGPVKVLTHTRPDSWERLEEDAEFNDETGIVGGNLDIVRRAKALAGMEVGR